MPGLVDWQVGKQQKTSHVCRIWQDGKLADNRKISTIEIRRLSERATFFLIGSEFMPKLNKKSALDIIVKAAKEYDAKLNDNHFLVIYQENGKYLINYIGFRD